MAATLITARTSRTRANSKVITTFAELVILSEGRSPESNGSVGIFNSDRRDLSTTLRYAQDDKHS